MSVGCALVVAGEWIRSPIRLSVSDSGNPLDGIDRLLDCDDRRLVGLNAEGWFLVEYIPTGHLRQRGVRVGNATYSADIPEVVPRITGRSDTLTGLIAAHGNPDLKDDAEYVARWAAYDEKQAAIRASLIERDNALDEMVRRTLEEGLAEAVKLANPLSPQDRRPCRNCDGLGGKERTDCHCKMFSSHHHLGLVAHKDDVVIDDPTPPSKPDDEPDFDPQCVQCHGTGTYMWVCPTCKGSGVNAACYSWTIVGPTGETSVLLDVAALVRSGEATLRVDLDPINRATYVRITVDFTPLIRRINQEVAQGGETWTLFRGHHQDWRWREVISFTITLNTASDEDEVVGKPPYLASDGPFRYSLINPFSRWESRGQVAEESPWVSLEEIDTILPSASRLLDLLQESATPQPWADLNEQDGVVRGADGSMEARRIDAVPKRSVQETFHALYVQAKEEGLALGFDYSFIATGESGPAVYLLDTDGTVISQIGLDYQWHIALADAGVSLPEVAARLRARDDEGEWD